MKRIASTLRILRRPGRRGWSLIFFSFLYIVLGQSISTTPNLPVTQDAYFTHLNLMSFRQWGSLWIAVGIVCAVGALHRGLQPTAFGLASGLMCTWAGGFAINWADGHGYKSYVAFFIYFAFSAFILLISGWPEGGDLNKDDER